jgi:hypothetical protein
MSIWQAYTEKTLRRLKNAKRILRQIAPSEPRFDGMKHAVFLREIEPFPSFSFQILLLRQTPVAQHLKYGRKRESINFRNPAKRG